MRVFGSRRNPLLLDTADGLDLRGLGMGAELLEVFVLPTVAVALHDILVSTITRELVAHKPVACRDSGEQTKHEMEGLRGENRRRHADTHAPD